MTNFYQNFWRLISCRNYYHLRFVDVKLQSVSCFQIDNSDNKICSLVFVFDIPTSLYARLMVVILFQSIDTIVSIFEFLAKQPYFKFVSVICKIRIAIFCIFVLSASVQFSMFNLQTLSFEKLLFYFIKYFLPFMKFSEFSYS